ncbi:MAG: glycerophosphodiester phosphodiesterase [Thermoleophilia bacterium]
MTVGPAHRPLLIAHRAGNRVASVGPAARAGADLVEIDLHLRRGRLEVRHARRLGPLPIEWDGWRVRPAIGPAPAPGPALAALPEGVRPLYDLKDGDGERFAEVIAAGVAQGRLRSPALVSSKRWDVLAALAGVPGLTAVHSVSTARRARALAALVERGVARAVCARRDLLSEPVARDLVRRTDLVMTWPVEDEEDAARLARWGVGGLIVDDLALLARLRRQYGR